MNPFHILASLLFAQAFAHSAPHYASSKSIYDNWKPPGPNDVRGPCPMLNTLANHGFLPHNGRNFTRPVVVKAFQDALNIEPAFASITFDQGLFVNKEPNATYFDLEQLSVHDVLEKDASLSRSDAYFGSNTLFNESVFQDTMKWWFGDHPTMDMLASSAVARTLEFRRDNPTYYRSSKAQAFSTGEVGSLFAVFGDREDLTVERKFLEFWFRNERFPTSLGWERPEPVTREVMSKLQDDAEKAMTLLTEFDESETEDEN